MNDTNSDAIISQTKIFSEILAAFYKSRLNFKYFQKKMTLIDFVFPKLRSPKT